MALIKCIECGKEISDQATTCPSCGKPVGVVKPPVVQVVTDPNNQPKFEIELTSKKWKRVILISCLVIASGFIVPAFLSGQMGDRQNLGWLIVFLGVVGLIVGKIGAWYSNR